MRRSHLLPKTNHAPRGYLLAGVTIIWLAVQGHFLREQVAMGIKSIIAIALVSIAAASAEAKPVEQLTGKVVSVTDGDTLRVYVTGDRTTTKVRLDSIDAPEKGQPFSAVAKKHLTEIAKGKNCTVRQMGKDKYGRVLGIVTILGTPRGGSSCWQQ
jgi:endonuclease YncB( thermonuclease family)